MQNTAVSGYDGDIPFYLTRAQCKLIFKCQTQQCAELDFWKCYPRRDISVTWDANPFGGSPPMLVNGFTNQTAEDKVAATVGYDDWDATPFMSRDWVNTFKLRKAGHKVLGPGQELAVKLPRGWRSKKVHPWRDGVNPAGAITGPANNYANRYYWMRKQGPIILVRARGCLVHDQSAATGLNPVPTVTMGPFCVEWVLQRTLQTQKRAAGFTAAKSVYSGRLFGGAGALARFVTQANADTFNQPAVAEQPGNI